MAGHKACLGEAPVPTAVHYNICCMVVNLPGAG